MFDVAGMLEEAKVNSVINADKKVIDAARKAGMKVIYLRMGYKPDFSNAGSVDSPNYWKEIGMALMHQNPEWMGKFVTEGTWDWQIIDELKPQQGDIVINKHRYSGFYNTELDTVLKNYDIRNLVYLGIATNVCVESTLRDGFFLEYFPILVSDGCGNAGPDFTQEATIFNVKTLFGWVTTSNDFVKALQPK